jgi:outer membrane protein
MIYYFNKRLFLLMVLALLAKGTFAQQQGVASPAVSLALPQVWEQAVLYNRTIQIQKLRVQGSEEEIKDAKAERLPDIKAEGEYAKVSNMPMFENGIFHTPTQYPLIHTYYKLEADAYFNIYSGNKTNLKIEEEQTINKIKEQQKNLSVSEIKLRASGYFLDLQRSIIFKQLMLNNIAEQEKQLDRIRQLLKHGVVLKSDVLRAELQLSRQHLTLTTIENDIAIANQKLNIMIGQPDSTIVTPVNPDGVDSTTVKAYADYLNDAMGHSFQTKISEQETNLRRLQVKDVKANLSPKIGLFANYAYAYPQIQFYPYVGSVYGLGMTGIQASFPISAFYQNKHKVKASEIEFKQQEIEHLDTQDNVRQQVNEAYLRYKEAINRISVAQTNIKQATENSRIINNTYFNQTSLVTDLLEANTQLLQTKFDLATAQIGAQMQYLKLQEVIGTL